MRVLLTVTTWAAAEVEQKLAETGFSVTPVEDGEGVFAALDLLGQPIVVIETDLPDIAWQSVVKSLRHAQDSLPIFVLDTAKSQADQIEALKLGADDVLRTNMTADELAARLHAVSARHAGFAAPNLFVGPLKLRLAEKRVYWGTHRVTLSPAEYSILEALCLAAPNVVRRDALMAELYGVEDGCEPRTINTFLSNLRSRLVAAGAPRDIIETERGRGYRLRSLEDHLAQTSDPAPEPATALQQNVFAA